ncbi:Ig-like domain-containing protein, partial [Pseudomonas mosselii]|uniref:Ig-like domain-containing protein n=1 Tax=Pseudomonas mosselii TaxID=78327 RepID=UPI002613E336
VTLKGTAAGVASVKASAVAGAATASVNLVPDGATAKVVDLTATPATIKANGADSSELVATIEDASGNPVAGAPVTWSTSTGNLSSASSVTDAQGKTRVTLKGTAAGVASVKASAVAGAATATVNLIAGAPAKVKMTASPTSVIADGVSTSVVTAVVTDAFDNNVGAGQTVSWKSNIGYLSAASSVTDAAGTAVITFTSERLAGIATVDATVGAANSSIVIWMNADKAKARVSGLTASPDTIAANGVASSTLTAQVTDPYGNNVGAGIVVTFTTSAGTLSATTATTNASGVATVTLRGTAVGTAAVTAKATAAETKTAYVTLVADASTAKVIGLTASPTAILANGSAASLLSATVVDGNGNPLGAGVPVTFSTNAGTLSATTAMTNASGVASVNLWGGTVAGTATVSAKTTVSANTVSTNVALVADASTATVVSLSASPTSIVADGSAATTLVATVRDANGNWLPAGQVVSFGTNLGTLSATSAATDGNGQASVVLRGTVAGSATVSARSVTATTQYATVTLTSAAPVINTFSVLTNGSDICRPANFVCVNGDNGRYEWSVVFSWAAVGADRYELVDPYGAVIYSGTATSVNVGSTPLSHQFWINLPRTDTVVTFTLRAYKNGYMSTKAFTAPLGVYNCGGGCSG